MLWLGPIPLQIILSDTLKCRVIVSTILSTHPVRALALDGTVIIFFNCNCDCFKVPTDICDYYEPDLFYLSEL